MKSFAIFLLMVWAAVSFGAEPPEMFSGTVQVAFGHVRNPDGSLRSVAGLTLPFYAERIRATRLHTRRAKLSGPFDASIEVPRFARKPFTEPLPTFEAASRPPAMFASTVFNADSGSYGVVGGTDPSAADDMVLQGGANIPWQNLTFGADIASVHSFLIRWIGFTNYTEGLGQDTSAFSGTFADFGVIFPSSQIPSAGIYKITISVAAAGVVAPQDNIFLAQQYRSTQPDGEGPFDTAVSNVYNPDAPASIGSSDNIFWYDEDPLNGIYTEAETDNFGDSQYANLLRTITVNGSQNTLVPFSYTLDVGFPKAGSLTDLWYSDDSWVTAAPNYAIARGMSPIELTFTGLSSTANITSLTFLAETGASTGGGSQVLSLWNYTTGAYEVVDTRTIPQADTLFSITKTNLPSKYVNQTNKNVKAHLAFNPPSNTTRGWFLRVDLANWTVTHP